MTEREKWELQGKKLHTPKNEGAKFQQTPMGFYWELGWGPNQFRRQQLTVIANLGSEVINRNCEYNGPKFDVWYFFLLSLFVLNECYKFIDSWKAKMFEGT